VNYLVGIDTSAHDKMMAKYGRFLFRDRPPRSENENAEDEPKLCIEGVAVIFNEPILNKEGEILVFERGCFNEHFSNRRRTEFWIAHDPSNVVGSTISDLEIFTNEDVVAFRMSLTNQRYAATIKRMVESKTQAAISVGITRSKERVELVGKHKVVFIENAELRECSLVAEGACEQAFARLIDARYNGTLQESINTQPFNIEQGLHNIRRQREKSASAMRDLAERLDALQAQTHTSM
jgi:HK97 family phage prohead protease